MCTYFNFGICILPGVTNYSRSGSFRVKKLLYDKVSCK